MFALKTGLRADKKTLGDHTIIHGGNCCSSRKHITIILEIRLAVFSGVCIAVLKLAALSPFVS